MTGILIALGLITVAIDISLSIFWVLYFKTYNNKIELPPQVSILVAARNEEANIVRCLESLIKLDYPQDKLEIMIGDDDSDDKTFEIAQAISMKYEHVNVYSFNTSQETAGGKANILAQLAKKASGEFYFITDADVAVPPTWIYGMLRGHSADTGIVTGVTAVENNELQHIDWTFAIGMVKVITDLGQPVTAMGNNMYVTREAYKAVGGYESIPFSVTEDFELFKQVRSKGFEVVQLYNEEVQARTLSIQGIIALLNQRKRWMTGAVQLPWPIVGLLSFQAIYYPVILILFFLSIKIAAVICFSKLISQTIFIAALQHRLRQSINWKMLIFYEFYAFGLSLASAVFFLIPYKIRWKGRKY